MMRSESSSDCVANLPFEKEMMEGSESPVCIADSPEPVSSTRKSTESVTLHAPLTKNVPARPIVDLDFILGDISKLEDSLMKRGREHEDAHAETSTVPPVVSKKRRRVVAAMNDADVNAYLQSPSASWNLMLPTGEVVSNEVCLAAATHLGFVSSLPRHPSDDATSSPDPTMQ